MSTLILNALMKVGAVVVIAGTTVAAPLLLNRGENKPISSSSDSGSEDSTTSDSVRQTESTVSSKEVTSSRTEGQQVARTDSDSLSQARTGVPLTSTPAISERFAKTCLEVPANYEDGSRGVKLLTCFDAENSKNEHSEVDPAFDSEFHVYDRSQNNIPLKIEGNLFWEHKEQKITAKVKKEEVSEKNEYIFTARGDGWNKVSSDSKIDLLNQCETYKVTSEGSVNFGKFWLSCADNTVDHFNPNSPTAIPLSSWANNQSTVS